MPSRTELRADCSRCFGLCCVAPAFTASADFAIDKPAGRPCPHLRDDFGCGIHEHLRPRGFLGCTVYDCFGAGQKLSQHTFGGRDWRSEPGLAADMFRALPVQRLLHELLYYLDEALTLTAARSVHSELRRAYEETERLTFLPAPDLLAVDPAAHRSKINTLLVLVSERARAQRRGPDHRGADLVGRDLHGTDLRGASLRGALLIGADLRRADLRGADFTGADLRGTVLSGANLSGALFLVQAQLDAARGDEATRLPPHLRHPPHWTIHT